MRSLTQWTTMGLVLVAAGWCLSGSVDAGERQVRAGLREHARERADAPRTPEQREQARERAGAPRTPEQREQARENVVDRREDRQAKRIEHGINKGYLTTDEAAKLQSQQDAIAAMESSFKGDGKLSRGEFAQLQQALNQASRCIWAEKHDTDGNQMPVFRLGKNVRINPDVAQKLADDNLSKEEARAFAKDFHRMLSLKHQLAIADLGADQRAKLQGEYNDLLNKYFSLVE